MWRKTSISCREKTWPTVSQTWNINWKMFVMWSSKMSQSLQILILKYSQTKQIISSFPIVLQPINYLYLWNQLTIFNGSVVRDGFANGVYNQSVKLKWNLTSAMVGKFFPYRHVEIIGSPRRHACRHNSSFKVKWNTRRKTVKTKVSRVVHTFIINLP